MTTDDGVQSAECGIRRAGGLDLSELTASEIAAAHKFFGALLAWSWTNGIARTAPMMQGPLACWFLLVAESRRRGGRGRGRPACAARAGAE